MHNEESKIYVAIDLKSFYASVECKERGLDPITTFFAVITFPFSVVTS